MAGLVACVIHFAEGSSRRVDGGCCHSDGNHILLWGKGTSTYDTHYMSMKWTVGR